MSQANVILAVLLAWVVPAAVADACGAMPSRAERAVVPATRINHGLLDAAFRAEVNRQRCANGLGALVPARGMVKQAALHSRWMATSETLSHVSTVRGRRTLTDRLKRSGLAYRTGAENIGRIARYRLGGASFHIEDARACHFSRNGQTLPPHTYASLARHAVKLWMASPAHRRNILNPRIGRVASAAAFDAGAPNCGRFWLTQTFMG